MKQLISWNEESKRISVIGTFTEDEAETCLAKYTAERVQELFDVSAEEAMEMILEENEIYLDKAGLTAEIEFPGGEYGEYLQVVDFPETDTIVADTASPACAGMHLIAYTDGSYNKMTGEYGSGVVMFEKDNSSVPIFHMKKGRAPEGENGWQVNGEVAAAEIAIEEAIKAGAKSLEIRYDYEGVEYWATGKWKRNKTYTKEYAEYVRKAGERLSITFSHVKGHSGDKWNDMADRLAKKACGVEA